MLHACVERFDVMGGRGNILGWDGEVNKAKIPLFHLQEIGQALLPLPGDAKSQPATATPVAATPTAAPTEAAPAAATPTPLSPYTNVSVNLILYSHCTSEPECPCHAHYSAIGVPCSTQISNRRHPLAAP
jgi:hypothetical protein